MEVPKEIIRPGTYTYLNQSGQPERMTVTADTIKHFHDQGCAMLAANLAIPVPLEHQPDAKVQTPSERAAHQILNNAGFVKNYEIRKVEGEDRLFGILDIPDKTILAKLPTTIRSVSPWINSFTDGNGKKWDGVISHVALTTRPRIAKQAPFESVALAMTGIMSAKDRTLPSQPILHGEGIALSFAGLLKKKDNTFKPKFPIAFSLMTGVKLSKEDLEEIDEETQDGDDADTEGGEAKKPDGEAVDQFAKDDTMAGMEAEAGDVSFEELIPHLLELHGIHVPAGGKGKEFLQALVQGLLTSAKSMAATDGGADGNVLGDDPAKTGAPPAPKGPITQESPPMYMSLTAGDVAKIADPKEKQVAEAFLSLREENARNKAAAEAAGKNILAEAAKSRQVRVERIMKRVPQIARDKIAQQLAAPGAQLSLGADGAVRDPMATMLEVFEAGIPDLPAMLREGVKLSEQSHPHDDGTITDARADELASKMLGRSGEAPKPSAA